MFIDVQSLSLNANGALIAASYYPVINFFPPPRELFRALLHDRLFSHQVIRVAGVGYPSGFFGMQKRTVREQCNRDDSGEIAKFSRAKRAR